MAKIQFLTILLTVTCFLGDVVSVTDKEFEVLVMLVDKVSTTVQQQSATIQQQSITIERQSDLIEQLRKEDTVMKKNLQQQEFVIRELSTRDSNEQYNHLTEFGDEFIANITIEERVALLEIQVAETEEDLAELEGDVNFLFDETVIQDERLYSLELDNDVINQEVDDLQDTTLALDFRITTQEENMGSVELRVETLEGAAANHETRISAVEVDVNELVDDVSNQDTRLTTAEEHIQGLQMSALELDLRVMALEANDTIAFSAAFINYDPIPVSSAVLFDLVQLNEGDGYDRNTGTFTVPPGGDGYYYFSTYLLVHGGIYAYFDLAINGNTLCTAPVEQQSDEVWLGNTACNGIALVSEGDIVQVLYRSGTDTTPLSSTPIYRFNGFTGFRLQ